MKKLFFSLLLAAALCCTYSCETEMDQLIIFDPSSNTGDSSDPSDPGTGQPDVPSIKDLSLSGAANCYIVSEAGLYKFKAVKGNSSESVGTVLSAEVLWESFGTLETPEVGSLISKVEYKDNYIAFSTPSTFKEGNAVIAAKDASGSILWSWHIWLTDKPVDQIYNNGAGTMMDRNLGATSATPGDVGALGLLYQWGRKDPFLGGVQISYSSFSNQQKAASTISWPSAVGSNSSNVTIDYATKHPTTFITSNVNNYDWYYSGSSSTDNTRWQSSKTIYDPCPAGYRVPDGGRSGVWCKAFGYLSSFSGSYDSINEGFNFGRATKRLTISSSTCWYPAAGLLHSNGGGSLRGVGSAGNYWSCTPDGYYAYYLCFNNNGDVYPSDYSDRVYGQSVRCLRE